MNEIKKILNKFRVTRDKMNEIKNLQKQIKEFSDIIDKIKNIYASETDIDIKKKLLFVEHRLIKSAQIKNDKAGELLDKLNIYIHS